MINALISTPRKVFLLDSLGALVSSLALLTITLFFSRQFGMPATTPAVLAGIAAAFGLYSASCYFFVKQRWRPFLAIICTANALYCCLTLGLVFSHYPTLTLWGLAYFIGEVVVIVALLGIELKTIRSPAHPSVTATR